MELLGHVVILSLTFWGTAQLFSTVAMLFYGDQLSVVLVRMGMTGESDWVATTARAHPLSPSIDRVAPRKAGLAAQPARQPVGEEPQHGALGRHAVPGHGNYLCVTIATWPGVLLCGPAAPLPGASWTGRASSLPCSRYPIAQLLPSLWLSPAPGGRTGGPILQGGGQVQDR